MSKIADVEANATSLDGLVNDNGLIPTLRNGPKPSYQYLIDGWNEEIAAAILEVNKSRGFRVVGDFASGFTYELPNDVAVDASGNYWAYADVNALPITVSAGTTPSEPTYTQVTFNQASGVTTTAGINAQQFIDNFELKIFQSPTDNLTKVETFAGGVGVVYEVRKTADNSLATIYSDKDGATSIPQNGISNMSNGNAEVVFYIADGDYTITIGGESSNFSTIKQVVTNSPLNANIDMHFGALLGVSAVNPQGSVERSIASDLSIGDMELTLTLTSPYVAGSLLCYLADDGEWYPTVVHSAIGSLVKLKYPIQAACSTSKCIVSNFMRDNIHPNQRGYNTVVDYALRTALYDTTKLESWSTDFNNALPVGGAVLDRVAPSLYENPGHSDLIPLQVTCASSGLGVQTPPLVNGYSGDMLVKVYLNYGVDESTLAGAAEGLCQTKVQVLDGNSTIATKTVSSRSVCDVVRLVCNKKQGSNLTVKITSLTGGQHKIWVSKVEVHKINSADKNINIGTHVIAGDSWTVGEGISPRLKERLSKVTFIDSGVSGDKSSDVLGAWGGRIAQYNPDYIWMLVGTNDFYGSVTKDTYDTNIRIMSGLSASLASKFVYFTASVGQNATLDLSRKYALGVDNASNGANYDDIGVDYSDYEYFELSIPNINLDPNTAYTVGFLPGTTDDDVLIDFAFFKTTSDSFVDVKLGFLASPFPAANDINLTGGEVLIPNGSVQSGLIAEKTGAGGFCCVTAKNTSGSNLRITGTIKGRWKPVS